LFQCAFIFRVLVGFKTNIYETFWCGQALKVHAVCAQYKQFKSRTFLDSAMRAYKLMMENTLGVVFQF